MENGTNGTGADLGNTKAKSHMNMKKKYRNYCFTLNNWSEKEIGTIKLIKRCEWFYGIEVGESGTKHLQGFLMYKSARSFMSIKKLLPRAHIEIMRGTKQDNIDYCMKEGKYETNIKVRKGVIDKFTSYKPHKWQSEILEIIKGEVDDRCIYWYWEEQGNVGKSCLVKHMIMKHNALVISGKESDIKYGIAEWVKEKDLEIVCIDIPRSSINRISYKAIERIKDGFFYSTKYESGMCVFNPPHVLVFANSEPKEDMMSLDRWKVVKITDTIMI